MNLNLIEECIKGLADCREACASTTLISPHMMMMTQDQVSDYTKHDLARRLAGLLVEDAEITEGISWTDEPGQEPNEMDTRFTARTVVMKASTYHALCQALRRLKSEAIEAQYRTKP